jgi:hypothetical protein
MSVFGSVMDYVCCDVVRSDGFRNLINTLGVYMFQCIGTGFFNYITFELTSCCDDIKTCTVKH